MKAMPVPLVVPADLRLQVARIARKAKAKQAEVFSVKKVQLSTRQGEVATERRRQIARKVIQCLAFADL